MKQRIGRASACRILRLRTKRRPGGNAIRGERVLIHRRDAAAACVPAAKVANGGNAATRRCCPSANREYQRHQKFNTLVPSMSVPSKMKVRTSRLEAVVVSVGVVPPGHFHDPFVCWPDWFV